VWIASPEIKPRIEEILGHDHGYNGQLQRWRLGERQRFASGAVGGQSRVTA